MKIIPFLHEFEEALVHYYCYLCVHLPHGAVGWSAMCDCDVSWSYSLAFRELDKLPVIVVPLPRGVVGRSAMCDCGVPGHTHLLFDSWTNCQFCPFPTVPWVGLQCVILTFPGLSCFSTVGQIASDC